MSNECKGLRYRYRKYSYIGKNGDINEKIALTPLKRQSCKGDCDRSKTHACDVDWLLDNLSEEIDFYGEIPTIPIDAKNECVFQLCADVTGGSYEYPNDVDVELYFKVVAEDE